MTGWYSLIFVSSVMTMPSNTLGFSYELRRVQITWQQLSATGDSTMMKRTLSRNYSQSSIVPEENRQARSQDPIPFDQSVK